MSELSPDPETVEAVKAILRRDLMLGADTAIDDHTPLFGGDFDLDSLDALLLVTSVEKAFGIKIPSETLGREVFASVTSLARYIDQHKS